MREPQLRQCEGCLVNWLNPRANIVRARASLSRMRRLAGTFSRAQRVQLRGYNVYTRRTFSHCIVLACAPIAQMQAEFSRKLVAPLRGLLSHAVQAIEIVSSRAGRSAHRVRCARAEAVCLCIVLAHAAHSL